MLSGEIMADPRPVRVGRKARKMLVPEATMDASDITEEFHLPDTPEELSDMIDALLRHHAYVREIVNARVSGTDSVRRLQKQAKREYDTVASTLATERIYLEKLDDPAARKRTTKEIGRLARQCVRLDVVRADCDRYLTEWVDQGRDREAAERLNVTAVPGD